MDDLAKANIINYVIGVYVLLLLIIGTLGHIFLLLMCLLTELRKTPTFIFFAFMAGCDFISLYWWTLDYVLTPYFGIARQNQEIAWCKIDSYIQYSVLEGSAWLLVYQKSLIKIKLVI